MQIEIDDRWRVRARCDADMPVSASEMWGQMRDWMRFIRIDPLHASVRLVSRPTSGDPWSPKGSRFVIGHRLLGIGPDRIGRILRWREGRGFAFSDLSQRGVRVGFPHVCGYELKPMSESRCCLTISARGRWTARWLPRWIVRLWMRWVLVETRECLRREMNQFSAWLARSRDGSADVAY